ncbi:N-acetyltransferase [Sulfitobacter albidus]|uniref:N-acetyltransferase n=1 Tax=Sulfitobacter albidus TaxID=2829501 RepID=A0A975JEY1_9RHOB|nr:GNAT family N-acetyltransferase [Sulfitobacter albidus]QUJ77067.1 N-acetyltransferase [Sulfitobacter albidus]
MIRDAGPGDLPAIGALWNAMIRDTTATFTTQEKTPDDLAALLAARPGSMLVAEADGIAGFVTWGPFRGGPGYAHTAEHTIITARPGVAAPLMRAALARAHQQGLHRMVAAISGENARAIAFHTRMGFAKTGHLPQVGRKQGRWLDLILMTAACKAP